MEPSQISDQGSTLLTSLSISYVIHQIFILLLVYKSAWPVRVRRASGLAMARDVGQGRGRGPGCELDATRGATPAVPSARAGHAHPAEHGIPRAQGQPHVTRGKCS